MVAQVGSMNVSLTAEFGGYASALSRAVADTERGTSRIRAATGLTERSITSLQRTMSGSSGFRPYQVIAASRALDSLEARVSLLRSVMIATTAAFGGFTAALTSNIILRYADSFTNLSNQIRAVSRSSEEATAVTKGVAAVADSARASLSATGTLYSRIAKAVPNENPADILRYVETIQKALQLGGATAQESASAAIQFSQALQSDRLQGEELRAILETPLGNELAKGLGVTIARLREMSKDGELTARVVLGALRNIAPSIDRQFAGMTLTLDQALTVADNKLTIYFGSVNETYGATRLLGEAIKGFADNLESIIPLLAKAGLLVGTVFAARTAGALGDRATGGIQAIKDRIAARQEELKIAEEQARVAGKALQDAQSARSGLSLQRTFGDVRQFADTASVKAYEREVDAVRRLDEQRLSLLEKQRSVISDTVARLAEVSKNISPRAVALADKQAKAEDAVNTALARQADLRRQISSADTRITAAAGLQVTSTTRLSAVSEATRQKAALEREALAVEQSIARQREIIATSSAQIADLASEAERKATEQRVTIKRNEADALRALNEQIISNERKRVEAVSGLRRSATGLEARGREGFADEMRRAGAEIEAAAGRFATAQRQVAALQAASTAGAMAISGLRSAGLGLVAFLGGPWGVALAAATLGLTIFGTRSAEAAEKTRRAQQIIAEENEKLSKTGNVAAQRSILDDQVKAQVKRLEDVRDQLQAVQAGLASSIFGASGALFRSDAPAIVGMRNALMDLLEQLEEGKISITDFGTRINALGLPAAVIGRIRDEIALVTPEAEAAQRAIGAIEGQIEELDGKRAKVFVDVIMTDPFTSGSMTSSIEDARENRAQAAFLRMAQRNTAEIQYQRRLTDATDEHGAKVRALADEMMREAGIGVLSEAVALRQAEAIVKAQEARKGNSKVIREEVTLQEKLSRLQEEAAGSFLSDVDRKVLEDMKALKFAADEMERFRHAAEGGDYSGLDAATQALLQAERAKAAGAAYRDIVTQYGTLAQITPMLADKQAQLNYLVDAGKISTEQARQAMADYAMSFQPINQAITTGSEFTKTFVQGLLQGQTAAESLSAALRNLTARLADLAIDALFRSLLVSIVAPGTGVSGAGAVIGSVLHSGGIAGRSGTPRVVPAGAYASAPRYHSGFMPGELPAILKEGEAVLNDRLTGRMGRTMSGLVQVASRGAAAPVPSMVYSPQIDARGADMAAVARLERIVQAQAAEIDRLVRRPARQASGMRT